jgi:hypothetical protein
MFFRPHSFLLRPILAASLVLASSAAALPRRAHAQGCDIPLTSAYEVVPNAGCGGNSNLTVGDWNGDGWSDLVTTSCYDSSPSPMHIYLGSPHGMAPAPDVPSSATSIGNYVRTIDLNMDGKLDLIAGGNPALAWYGHGDGTFDAPVPVPGLPDGLNWIWTVDLNGDHRLDLVALVQNPDLPYDLMDHVRTFLANSTGGFADGPTLVLPNEDYQRYIRAEDLNGDGFGDLVLVVAPEDGPETAALVYLGDGTGGFQSPMTLHTIAGPPFDQLVDVLDWNGDGNLDIALGLGRQLDLYFGHGDGTFSEPVTTDGALPAYYGSPTATFKDVNGDSTPDAIEWSQGVGGGFRVLLGSPDGHVGAPRSYPNLPFNLGPTVVQAVGGPAPDIVIPLGGILLIYENLAGSFEEVPFANLPSGGYKARGADLNRDGRTDLVLYEDRREGDTFLVDLVTPELGVIQAQEISMGPPPSGYPIQDYRLSDLTGDGIPDLLVLRYLDYTHMMISAFRGLPGGTFGERFDRTVEYPPGEAGLTMLVGDLNRDGSPDLLMVPIGFGSADQMANVTFLAGHGDGTLDAPVNLFRTFDLYPAVLRDVNGDGTPDLLAYARSVPGGPSLPPDERSGPDTPNLPAYARSAPVTSSPGNGRSFTVRLANGDGTFGAPTTIQPLTATAYSTPNLLVGDVNGDGHADAVVVRSVPAGDADPFPIHVFLGHGDGTFSGAAPSIADSLMPSAYPSAYFLGDLNADGRADLIVGEYGFRPLCGQPDGTFEMGGSMGGYVGTSLLFQTDMDGDGGKDIAAVCYSSAFANPIMAFHRNLLVSLAPIIASITLDPPVIQPKSHAPWVHVTLELGADHQVTEVDPGSLRLLGVAPVEKTARIGDANSDGIPDLTLAFPREPFNQLAPGEHEVTLTGSLVGGVAIEAKATVRILETHGKMALRVVSPVGASPVVLEVSNEVDRGRTVRIFDVKGRLVRSWQERDAIDSRLIWDGRTASGTAAPSGIYFTRVSTPSADATTRTVLLH